MHTLTIRTKFTFGDRVRFDSQLQRYSGIGTILTIMVEQDGLVCYVIEIENSEHGEIRAGILEREMTLLEPASSR